jgi:hypothetical protein
VHSMFSLRRRELSIRNFRRISKVRKHKSQHRRPTTTNRGGRSRKHNTQTTEEAHGRGILNLATDTPTQRAEPAERSHVAGIEAEGEPPQTRAKATTKQHDRSGKAPANEEDNHTGIESASKHSTKRNNDGKASASTTITATSTGHARKVAKHPPSRTTTTVRNPPANQPEGNNDNKASGETTTTNRRQDDKVEKHPPRPRQPR